MNHNYLLKKSFVLILSFILILNFKSFSQNEYLSFTEGIKGEIKEQKTLPTRIVTTTKSNQIELSYTFSGAYISETKVGKSNYNFLHIEGFAKMTQVGAPALPMHNEIIALPKGSTGIVKIIDSEYKEYSGLMIHPTLEPARDTEGTPSPEFEKDDEIYSNDEFFPKNIVEIISTGINRGTLLAITQIRPVQFNPITRKIRVYSKIKYSITPENGEKSFDYIAKENTKHYTDLLKRNIINSESIPDGLSAQNQINNKSDAKNYIIITHSEYLSQANKLADWKRQLGYSVEVISKSSWTAAEVKTEVHNRYDAWTPKPDYFVIIGDHTGSYAVPGEIHQAPGDGDNFATDTYVACMDGTSDHIPDMAKGRISVRSLAEATVVIDKIINYEKTPPTTSSFYDNALSCAQFQDVADEEAPDGYAARRFCHTSEEIRDYLQDEQSYTSTRVYYTDGANTPTNYENGYYSDGQAIPSELLRANGFAWDGDQDDITTEINEGKFLVFHRDHGYSGGIGWAHPFFLGENTYGYPDNIASLSNAENQPVIFSMNCHTGEFQLDNCFAEEFLRVENKGAIGVIAAAYFSYSGYNDALSIGMIDAIWSDPGVYPNFGSGGTGTNYTIGAGNDIYTMGDVVNQGLHAMIQNKANNTYTFELFHYFGDPAMKIWTSNPNNAVITATHETTIDCANTTYSISESTPYATATLVKDNTLIGKTTLDASGTGTISYNLINEGNVTLTISKHNCKPYTTTITQTCSGYPPELTTSNTTNITSNSATLNAEIINDNGGIIIESGFVYSLTSSPIIGGEGVIKVETSPVVTSGTYQINISDLSRNTKYYFRAFATNVNFTGYSDDNDFVTLCGTFSLPITEDFSDGSLPSCWDIIDNETSGQIWQFNNPGGRTINTTSNANGFAILDSDKYGNGSNQNSDLITPTLDLSIYTSVNLSFEHYFRSHSPSSAELFYSIDGGSNWTSIQSWIEDSENAATFDQDVTAMVAGESNVKFKWNYIGSYAYYWAIDDISITGIEIDTPTATISTTPECETGTVTVSTNLSGTHTFYLCDAEGVEIANNTVDASSYDFTEQTDGIYTGKVEKLGNVSELTDPVTLTNYVQPETPTSVSATETTICLGENITLSYEGGSGNVFNWYSDAEGTTIIGINNDFDVSPISDTTYYGGWNNECGNSESKSIAITVNPTYNIDESVSVCSGESYTFPDETTANNITEQVIHISNLLTVLGCDSIIETTVDVLPIYDLSESVSVCSGESYTFPDETTVNNITEQVIHTSNFLTVLGCDSIIETTVDVLPIYDLSESVSVCSGESYTFPDETTINNITEQVIHTSNILTVLGCDSIIETTVNVLPVYDLSESVSVCSGESYTFPDETTVNNITEQIIHTSNLQTVLGCDSIIETTVNVIPIYDLSESVSVCSGESYTFPDETTVNNITEQIIHTSSFISVLGCDSIIETTVNVMPNYDISESVSVCNGESYTFPDETTVNNITEQIIHTSNLVSVSGCDSIIVTTLLVTTLDTSITKSENTLTANANSVSYQWINCTNNTLMPDETNKSCSFTESGDYAVIISDDICTDTSYCYNITIIGIKGINNTSEFSVFPNPTNGKINIEGKNIEFIEVTDINGSIIWQDKTIKNNTEIDLSNENKGIYFIRITSNKIVEIRKVILK